MDKGRRLNARGARHPGDDSARIGAGGTQTGEGQIVAALSETAAGFVRDEGQVPPARMM